VVIGKIARGIEYFFGKFFPVASCPVWLYFFSKFVVGELAAGKPDDTKGLGQELSFKKAVERGGKTLPRQVSGSSKNDQDGRVKMLFLGSKHRLIIN